MTGYASSKCPFFHKGLLWTVAFRLSRSMFFHPISIFYCFYWSPLWNVNSHGERPCLAAFFSSVFSQLLVPHEFSDPGNRGCSVFYIQRELFIAGSTSTKGGSGEKLGTSKNLPKSFIEALESFYFWRSSMSGHARLDSRVCVKSGYPKIQRVSHTKMIQKLSDFFPGEAAPVAPDCFWATEFNGTTERISETLPLSIDCSTWWGLTKSHHCWANLY